VAVRCRPRQFLNYITLEAASFFDLKSQKCAE
jgi:hypothetical protein